MLPYLPASFLLDMVHDGSRFIGLLSKINFSKLNMFIYCLICNIREKRPRCKQVSANLILCIQSIEVINTALIMSICHFSPSAFPFVFEIG